MIVFALLVALAGCQLGPSTNILATTQFYFIPDASYLQFRVSEAELGNFVADTTISKIQGTLNFTIANSNPQGVLFNVIVLPPKAPVLANYQFYNCYMRAAFEGIQTQNCQIGNQTASGGDCGQCVEAAINGSLPWACTNCSTNFLVDIYQNLNSYPRSPNNTIDANLLMIIDNTNVIATAGKYLELYLGYALDLTLNESDETVILFFLVLLVVVIAITLLIAVYLTCKIRKLNACIDNHNKLE